jgi:hypothetical protein
MLLLKGYKLAKVEIDGYGDHYVAHYEDTLDEGDRVVVADVSGDFHLGVVSIVLDGGTHMSKEPTIQVVCKVDTFAYETRCVRAQKAEELERQLNEAVADFQKIALFEMMAEKSPAIAKMLEQYKEVTGAQI